MQKLPPSTETKMLILPRDKAKQSLGQVNFQAVTCTLSFFSISYLYETNQLQWVR